MTVNLRDYQRKLVTSVFHSWQTQHNAVLAVMPTGAGKSIALGAVVKENGEPTCVMVHRGELVAQLSETLAMLGITHRIIASSSTRSMCVARHVAKFGRSFVHDQSPIGVASVQTIVKRAEQLKQWLPTVKLVVCDEAHHYLADNQFGTAVKMFPNAKVLGVTATPDRCDKKSLATTQKTGIFNIMVEGPSPRWLMEQGFLAKYKYYAPPPSIKMGPEDISESTGDYKLDAVRKKSHESRIVGDVVGTYQKYALGKQAIAFTVDVETAQEMAKAFNEAGIPAAAVSGKTPDSVRNALMAKFASGNIKVLANCSLFSEGLDLPGVEVAILARPTQSLTMYRQCVGRALRPVYAKGFDLETVEGRISAQLAGSKPYAIIIDHVESYAIHKLPDADRTWSLIRPEGTKRSKNRDDEIPLRSCVNEGCWQPYEATFAACPHCGFKPEPASRSTPEAVSGDIIEFGPDLIAKLKGEIARVDGAPQIPYGASPVVDASIRKRWRERREKQEILRNAIAWWAAYGKSEGRCDQELYRTFWYKFGNIDVLTAQTLNASDAAELTEKVINDLPNKYLPEIKS